MRKVLGLLSILLRVSWATLAMASDGAQPAFGSVDSVSESATLQIWNRPIMEFRAYLSELSPQERALRAANRIDALSLVDTNFEVTAQSAQVGELSGQLVAVDGQPTFAVLPGDPDPESKLTVEAAASQAAARLSEVLKARVTESRPARLWHGLLRSLVATALFLLLAWMLLRLRGHVLARLDAVVHRGGMRLLKLDVKPFLNATEQALIRLFSLAVLLAASYAWLFYVLEQFHYSKPWGDRLGGYFFGLVRSLGLGVLGALPDLFVVLVIFVATRLLIKAVAGFFKAVEAGQIDVTWARPDAARATRRIFAAVIWLFALTVAYPYIPGSGTDAFKGVSVFAGLMISLGSTGLVNQLMSGFVVIYSRALKAGDMVAVGASVGKVIEVGFLSTKIMSVRREEITIPNAVMIGSAVTNYSSLAGPDGAMAATSVTIGYDAPWRQVHAMLLLAASHTPGVRKLPEPFVIQRALSDFYVEYDLRFRLEVPEDRFTVLSLLHGSIQDAFNESGVQIMSPHFEGQPEKQVVVPKSKWFAPPAKPEPELTPLPGQRL